MNSATKTTVALITSTDTRKPHHVNLSLVDGVVYVQPHTKRMMPPMPATVTQIREIGERGPFSLATERATYIVHEDAYRAWLAFATNLMRPRTEE